MKKKKIIFNIFWGIFITLYLITTILFFNIIIKKDKKVENSNISLSSLDNFGVLDNFKNEQYSFLVEFKKINYNSNVNGQDYNESVYLNRNTLFLIRFEKLTNFDGFIYTTFTNTITQGSNIDIRQSFNPLFNNTYEYFLFSTYQNIYYDTNINFSYNSIAVGGDDCNINLIIYEVSDFNSFYNYAVNIGYNNGYAEGNIAGYNTGFNEGNIAGYNNGYNEGNRAGYNNGFNEGNRAGYNNGYAEGEEQGKIIGYSTGYNEGRESGTRDGYASGLQDGYNNGYTVGKSDGYELGYNAGVSYTANETNASMNFLKSFFNTIWGIINTKILGFISIGTILLFVIGMGVVGLIFRLIKG